VLDSADKKLKLRASHLNPMVTDVYRELLGVANSHTAHTLLHTSYSDRRRQSVSPCIEDVWKELDLLRGAESED
jgi:ferredoxin hydrogenase gamma subunit